ncbi:MULTISPECIES: phage integrase N-terminal domain-containing protein [Xenorhabdus]|nr:MULTISPECIES: phage integrase N-terminal domain-containing protein [Xenorhabdus]
MIEELKFSARQIGGSHKTYHDRIRNIGRYVDWVYNR